MNAEQIPYYLIFIIQFKKFKGKIYAVGGHDGVERHKSVEVYHIDRNQWYMGPDLIHPRSDLACVSFNGRIFAIGGFTGSVSSAFFISLPRDLVQCSYT